MADKRADQHPNKNQQDREPDKSHRFINEKIVRQPMSRRQIARKILLTVFCAMLFGVLSAVCFVVSRPVAERFLGQETPEESSQITIPKDNPETTQATVSQVPSTEVPAQTEPVDVLVRSAIEKYNYSVDDLNKLYSNLRTIAVDADDSLVVVHSIQHEKDWFDNPIETSGQFSGIIIARTRSEILILTPEKAVEAADSIEVAFPDSTMMAGTVKQSDTITGLAVVSVDAAKMDSEQFKKVEAIEREFLWGEAGGHRDCGGSSGGNRTLQRLRQHFLCRAQCADRGRQFQDFLYGCQRGRRRGNIFTEYLRRTGWLGHGQI